jgi:hypothetical protein
MEKEDEDSHMLDWTFFADEAGFIYRVHKFSENLSLAYRKSPCPRNYPTVCEEWIVVFRGLMQGCWSNLCHRHLKL